MEKNKQAVIQRLLREIPGLMLGSEIHLPEHERRRRHFQSFKGGAAGQGGVKSDFI